MSNTAKFKGGLDLKFFEHAEFEILDQVPEENKPLIIARNALRFLMMGWQSSWTGLISWSLIKAVSFQRDSVLVGAMRLAFQQGFDYLFQQLRQLELNEDQKEQVQLYLSNCLSLLPYSDLTPYESIKIPQLINNKWELVDYYVTPIELTSSAGKQGRFLKDHERVFAYGLQAINNEQAQSHLIFMGTTYPAGQGFISQITADFKAFDHVGNSLYQSGREKIKQWLAEQKKKVHVCGVSLGGALSLLLAIDQGEHIERVDALNSPGLATTGKINPFDRWDSLPVKPKVVIQQQGSDPVSIFGEWKNDWEIIQVKPPKDKQGPNPFYDHFLNYAGFADTEFTYVSAIEENQKRKYRNVLIFSWARGILYFAAIWPMNFLLRPTIYFLYEQLLKKSVLLSIGIGLSIVALLSFLSLAPIYLALSSVFGGLISYGFILPRFFGKSDNENYGKRVGVFAKLHDPELSRNSQLDIYNPDNAIDLNLSYGELNTYYRVRRCLGKQKEFIPTEHKPYKHHQAISKKILLERSQDPVLSDATIEMHVSKAKAITIKRTLALIDRFGMNNSAELKEAVDEEYKRYSLGK